MISAPDSMSREDVASLHKEVQEKYGHNAFARLPDAVQRGMRDQLRRKAREERASKKRFSYPIPIEKLNVTTVEILELVQCLPCIPEWKEFRRWVELLCQEIPAMAVEVQMRIAHEVFVSTYQLREIQKCLENRPTDPLGSFLLVKLVSFLCNGSKRTQKAILKQDLLRFLKGILYSCTMNLSDDMACCIGASALQLCSSLLAQNRKGFEQAMVDNISQFMMTCGFAMAQYDWTSTSKGKRFSAEAMLFVTRLFRAELNDSILHDLRAGCQHYVLDNVLSHLSQAAKPDHWFDHEGLHPGVDKISEPMQRFLSTPEARITGLCAEDVISLSKKSFMDVVVDLFTEFVKCKVVDVNNVDDKVWNALAQLCLDRRLGRGSEKMLLFFLHSFQRGRKLSEKKSTCKNADSLSPVIEDMKKVERRTKCGNMSCARFETESCKFKVCSGCRLERYCSDTCGKAAWKYHKFVCGVRASEQVVMPSQVASDPEHALQAGLVPEFQGSKASLDQVAPCMDAPARDLGDRYYKRIRELQETLNFGDLQVFQRAEAKLEEELRFFEGVALCYRIYCKRRLPSDHELILRLIMGFVCGQGEMTADLSCWPEWVQHLKHDLHISQTYKWLQNVNHLTDQICLDRHSLLCGRTRQDRLAAAVGCFLPDEDLDDYWWQAVLRARASFKSFDCVLIQRCHFGRKLVEELAKCTSCLSEDNDTLNLLEEEEYMRSRLRPLLLAAGFGRAPTDFVVETRLAAWWTLPSTCSNCVSLFDQQLGSPDRADPRATKSINEISDAEALNIDAELLIPDFLGHVRIAYARHLWEALHVVLGSSLEVQGRLGQCDECGEQRILKPCVCGLESYCVGDPECDVSACQQAAWHSGHSALCPGRCIAKEWMSSFEESILRQIIGIHPDAHLNHLEKMAMRVVGRKGEPWNSMRADGRSLASFNLLRQHICVEGCDIGHLQESVNPVAMEEFRTVSYETVPEYVGVNLCSQAWSSASQ